MAADVVVATDFEDGTSGLTIYSNTAQSGIVATMDGNAVYEDVFTRDETQTLLFSEFGEVDSVEVAFDFRFPDGIPVEEIPRQFGSVKLSRLNPPDGSPRYHSMQNDLQFMVENGTVSYELSFYVEHAEFADRVAIDDPTEWTTVRYQALRNTPGQNDGVWKVWVNDALVVNRSDVRFVDNADYFFTSTWTGGNISFGGADPAQPFRRQLDNVRYVVNLDGNSDPEGPTTLHTPATRIEDRGGNRVLVVVGDEAADVVELSSTSASDVVVRRNGEFLQFTEIDSIEVSTGTGADRVTADVFIPITIDAGAGDDSIYVKAPQALLRGGAGNDSLFAYGGSQILVGGAGADFLVSMTTVAPHVIATGELDSAAESTDQDTDFVYSLGYFDSLIFHNNSDLVRRWRMPSG